MHAGVYGGGCAVVVFLSRTGKSERHPCADARGF